VDDRLMEIAWKVEAVPADPSGDYIRLNWVTRENGATIRLTDEPGQSFWRNLKVALVQVDAAPVLKRFAARAKGRGARIIKRNSHITVGVSDGKKD
jgi:hypothetical protein